MTKVIIRAINNKMLSVLANLQPVKCTNISPQPAQAVPSRGDQQFQAGILCVSTWHTPPGCQAGSSLGTHRRVRAAKKCPSVWGGGVPSASPCLAPDRLGTAPHSAQHSSQSLCSWASPPFCPTGTPTAAFPLDYTSMASTASSTSTRIPTILERQS